MSSASIFLSLIVLAVVQGVTEFLPISSSGHLALAQLLMHVGEGSLVEDIVLHLGTLVAVVVFYRRDLWRLVTGFFGRFSSASDVETDDPTAGVAGARRYVLLLVLGNVPAGLVGVFLKDSIEGLFDRPAAVLAAMAATAVLLASTRALTRKDGEVDWRKALLIGLAQSVAILPGASRSGWTIATALALGVRPAEAARFSFLLSIPAIAGAAVLQLGDLEGLTVGWGPLAAGFVVSALTGLLCLRWLVVLVRKMALHLFAYYLGALVVVGSLILYFGGARG